MSTYIFPPELRSNSHFRQRTGYSAKGEDVWRPWEVALFAQCASQDPWFKHVVVGRHGLPSLIDALDVMLAKEKLVLQVDWENVALTLRALAFLSEQEWVAESVDQVIIRSLLRVFRYVSISYHIPSFEPLHCAPPH